MKIINGDMYFTKKEVAELVGRTPLTIHNYASWSEEREKEGKDRFLPKPLLVGRYRYWSNTDIEKIKEFFDWVDNNRGALVEYSKRLYTKKEKN